MIKQEFFDIINLLRSQSGDIYLVDILERMHFLIPIEVGRRKSLHKFMKHSKQNLLIQQFDSSGRSNNNDICVSNNLFKIVCAILNIRLPNHG